MKSEKNMNQYELFCNNLSRIKTRIFLYIYSFKTLNIGYIFNKQHMWGNGL